MVLVLTIYSLFVLVFIVLVFWKPPVGIMCILLMFTFEQWAQASSSYFLINNWLTNYIFVALIILGIVVNFIRNNNLNVDRSVWPILLLFLYALTSVYWSSSQEIAIENWLLSGPFILLMILFAPLLLSKTTDLKFIFYPYLLIASLLVILLLFSVDWWGRYLVFPGVTSNFSGNPLEIGHMGIMLILFSMVLETKKYNSFWKLFRWVFVILGFAIAIRSQSRGQLFAAAIAITFALWVKKDNKDINAALILVVVFLVLSIIASIVFNQMINESNLVSDEDRWTVSKIASDGTLRIDASLKILRLWISDPRAIIFGLGNSSSYDPNIIGLYPHVVPIEVLTEEGLIGFVLFCYLIYKAYRRSKYLLYTVKDRILRSYVSCLIGMFIIELLLMFKQGSLLGSYKLFMIMVIISCLANYERRRSLDLRKRIRR